MVTVDWNETEIEDSLVTLSSHTIGSSQPPVLRRVLQLRELRRSPEQQAIHASLPCIVDDVSPRTRWKEFAIPNFLTALMSLDLIIARLVILKFYPFLLPIIFWVYFIRLYLTTKMEEKILLKQE